MQQKLLKILNEKNNDLFLNINKNIEIDFENIVAPLSNLVILNIGKIEKENFVKISQKLVSVR